MRVQIYISDNFADYYMPFLLFRNSCHRVLSTMKEEIETIEFIYDIHDIHNDPSTIVIMNMYDINLYDGKDYIRQVLFQEKVRFLIINTEHWEMRKGKEIFEILNKRKSQNILILEYNVINYEVIIENYKQVPVLFLPLLYDQYLEDYYKGNIVTPTISWVQPKKDIDVLFYGSLNERRHTVFNKLHSNWNVHLVDSHHGAKNDELCQLIQRSKVVINVMFYPFNITFDYYRNALLLSNRCIVVIETPIRANTEHEYWLKDLDSNIINASYDNMADIVDQTLRKSSDEIEAILTKQYEWFKKTSLEDILVPFFKHIHKTGTFPEVR